VFVFCVCVCVCVCLQRLDWVSLSVLRVIKKNNNWKIPFIFSCFQLSTAYPPVCSLRLTFYVSQLYNSNYITLPANCEVNQFRLLRDITKLHLGTFHSVCSVLHLSLTDTHNSLPLDKVLRYPSIQHPTHASNANFACGKLTTTS
jgi:hypothetical protein